MKTTREMCVHCCKLKELFGLFVVAGVLLVSSISCGEPASGAKNEKATQSNVAKTVKKSISESRTDTIGESYPQSTRMFTSPLDSAYQQALSLFPVRFQEMNVNTSFGKVHVIETGNSNKPWLILLHGMNASSTMWYPNIAAFTKNFHVLAIDCLLEPNRSKRNQETLSLNELVQSYREVLDHFKITSCSVVGASRGGWIAVNLGIHLNDRIKKMVLLSPAQTFMWISPSSELLANVTYSIAPSEKRLQQALSGLSSNMNKIPSAFINQFDLATEESGIDKNIFRMRPFSESDLERLKFPVLVLIGDQDFINRPRSLENAKNRLPQVETAVVANAGHFLSIDQPTIVNRQVVAFLQKK